MIKRSTVWLLVIAAALVTLTGCPPGIDADSGDTGNPLSARGRRPGNGGLVTVVVTMNATYTVITDVTAEGPGETYDGISALSALPQKMKEQQKIDVDGITHATITSDAIKGAAQDAYNILMTRKP
jgi:fumarate reductase flavoprotein subunit